MSDNTQKHRFPIMKMNHLVDQCPYIRDWYNTYTVMEDEHAEHKYIEAIKQTFNAQGVTWF